ncbi:MAG: alkaline phosphatase family protein [Chloroflexi bacterium]|nr:alkaline phosphatase family protein [Chloroflexota bacterium]
MSSPDSMCLVCVFDGLRPEMVRPDWTPHLHRLRQQGVWFSQSHCVFPSVTRVNASSLATGCFPGAHGIEGNTVWRPQVEPLRPLNTSDVADLRRLRQVTGRMLLAPTVGEVLAAAGRKTIAVGTGSSGCGYLMHPEAASVGGLVYHHDFTTPPDLAERVATALGPPPYGGDYGALAVARVEYAARALSDVLLPLARPALAFFWITVPDGLHHRYGLGSPEALAALQAADASFGALLTRLSQQGLRDRLDVIITSDHGYATVSGHVDVVQALVEAGLKHDRVSDDLVICADGGAFLLYAAPSVDTAAVAQFLLSQPWVTAVFSRDGPMPGALPLGAVGGQGPHAPDLVAALAWEDGHNGHGVPGLTLDHGHISVGAGNHGGISPFEMRNTLLAAGPHFRAAVDSQAPCGVVDIAPTVLRCLGLPLPAAWQGRVLQEAMVDPVQAPEATALEETSAFRGGRQVLTAARAAHVTYTAGARIHRA